MDYLVVSGTVSVSGLSTQYQNELVVFPSAVMGVGVEAYLSSINATFGFGSSAHRFDLQYIPADFATETLPTIGTDVEFSVGELFIKGEVKHADYSKSDKGNLISVSIEDHRTDLKNYYLDTQGVHGRNDTPETNIIDVCFWYLVTVVTQASGSARQTAVKEFESIRDNGASYRQIYNAVDYFENTLGTTSNLLELLPTPDVIENQLPGDLDAYRWRFIATDFLTAIGRILRDVSYDFYWNMKENKVAVVNRKFGVSLTKTEIPFSGDTSQTISFKYGNDEADKPNKVRLFGAGMEGILGSGTLIPESGAFNLAYDLGITVGQPIFDAGWEDVTIKYFGPDGELDEYTPTSIELRKALTNIEIWAAHKGLGNRITQSGWDPVSGFIDLSQTNAPGVNVVQITNRYKDQPWVVSWYNRVRTFADQHYGKTYILSPSSTLYGFIDDFDVVNQAWCNLENQTSGTFEDGYKIDSTYNMLSPFYDSRTNKIRAFAVFQSGTQWGNLGEASPAPIEKWNENSTNQFIPIKIDMWKSARSRFTDPLIDWDGNEKGVSVTLPNRVVRQIEVDTTLTSLFVTASGAQVAYSGNLTSDIQSPINILEPYEKLSASGNISASGDTEGVVGIAIPIKAKRRYGYAYPFVWTSGAGERLKTIIDERYSPWNFEPRADKDSIERLTDDVTAYLSSQKINTSSVTHAEVQKVGLPGISFDEFAKQTKDGQGYGTISHGITSININRGGQDYWRTRYSVKPHFPQLIKAKPVLDEIEEDFSFILHKIQQDIIAIRDNSLNLPDFINPEDEGTVRMGASEKAKKSIPVTVIQVFDRATGDPYYLSKDDRNIEYPRPLSAGGGTPATREARATDGLLDIGMRATYHYEEQEDGSSVQYYTGGVDISEAKVVTITSDVNTVSVSGTDFFTVDVTTIPSTSGVAIVLTNVPLIDQNNTELVNGSKISIVAPRGQTNIRKYDFTPDGNGDSDLFIDNLGGGTSVFAGFVSTAPADTGLAGAVSLYTSSIGQTVYTDGGTIDGTVFNVRFVSMDPRAVAVGDPVIAFRLKEDTGAATPTFRLICMSMGATFSSLPFSTS